MVTAADAVGLDRIEIIAGAGGGHLSHAKGTEIDVRGWNADGSRWTTRQRLAVAVAAAAAGGNRFGFYTQNGSPTALHVGLGASGIPRYVAWGPGMAVSDVDVSLFASEERAFVSALRNGNIEDYVASYADSGWHGPPTQTTNDARRAINNFLNEAPALAQVIGSGGRLGLEIKVRLSRNCKGSYRKKDTRREVELVFSHFALVVH